MEMDAVIRRGNKVKMNAQGKKSNETMEYED